MTGKKHKQKGDRLEREIVALLRSHGIEAERVPLSGAAGGSFAGDVIVAGRYKAEVKARANGSGFKLLEGWLEGNDLVIMKRDRKKPLIAMSFDAYVALLHAALNEPRVAPNIIVQEIDS